MIDFLIAASSVAALAILFATVIALYRCSCNREDSDV